MTGQMFEEIEKILIDEQPDALLVYGDTNSTLAGALAAKKMNIKIIHVEAGLRSFNMKMPEEVNRVLTDRISSLLLCPTDVAIKNLKEEGFENFDVDIIKCGDIMRDAVTFYGEKAYKHSSIISDLLLAENNFVLATIHRQENTDTIDKLKIIFESLEEIHKNCTVIMPLHPRTKKILESHALNYKIQFIEPVGYFDMLLLLQQCKIVITDSGGLQKEAFFNKKYSIIVRDQTEWVELVKEGYAKIVGGNFDKIIAAFEHFNTTHLDFSQNLYGNHVGEQIYLEIMNLLNKTK